MRKSVVAYAALAALGFIGGFIGTAFAGDAKTGASTTSTATGPTAMSDSDMDKVTAGRVAHAYGHANIKGGGKLQTAPSNHGHLIH